MTKPKIIAVLNPKGGCGKTTISINLAHSFKNAGYKVLLVDSDAQESTKDWAESNNETIVRVLAVAEMLLEDKKKTLEKIIEKEVKKDNYDLVIVDGASGVNKLTALTMKIANLILIPVQPSQVDLWAVNGLVSFIQTIKNQPTTCFVISLARKNTKLSKEIIEPLKGYRLKLLDTHVIMREKYKTCVGEGGTVFLPFVKEAAEEINNIRNELIEVLNGIKSKK